MTATPDRPQGTSCGKCQEPGCPQCFPKRTTLPEKGPTKRTPLETDAAALLQRAVEEADTEIRAGRQARVAADTRIERAIERRRDALRALACIGIEPTLESAGETEITSGEEGE